MVYEFFEFFFFLILSMTVIRCLQGKNARPASRSIHYWTVLLPFTASSPLPGINFGNLFILHRCIIVAFHLV